jgi:hypothetical protein
MAVQRRFGGTYYFYLQIRRLSQPSDQKEVGGEEYLTRKIKALRTSETSTGLHGATSEVTAVRNSTPTQSPEVSDISVISILYDCGH